MNAELSDTPLIVTVEVSMYPLAQDVEPPIVEFIQALRRQPDIDLVTNAMSTQLRGTFEAVQHALATCMREALAGRDKVLFVTKTLNLGLDIDQVPALD